MRKLKKITRVKSTKIDPLSMLENITEGKELLKLRRNIKVFSQGADADAIYFIQSGRVKLTVAWVEARDAAMALLGPGDFFGEGCLIGQSLRINTAATTESSTIFKIQRTAMLQAFHAHPELSEKFIASLIIRNIDVEEDICNQIFNRTEKQLAHILLKLNRYGRADSLPDDRLPQISHETLAGLVGATRSHILQLLDKFRKLGLIDYNGKGEMIVRTELLTDMVLNV